MLELLKKNLTPVSEEALSQTINDKEERSMFVQGNAAVLAAFTRSDDPQLVLTQRSEIMRAHAGEVAFPGGKVEEEDDNLLITALRESEEEIGLLPEQVEIVGQADAVQSRAGIKVQPFVGIVDESLHFTPRTEELDAVFKAPVSLFYDSDSLIMHRFELDNMKVSVPGFQYEGFTIWGLTAAMIVNILNDVSEEKIVLPKIEYSKK